MKQIEIKNKLLSDVEGLKTQEGYLNAGYPNYSKLFGRDSLITAWQMLEIDPRIARATLEILAKHQGRVIDRQSEEEPGKILHEFEGSNPEWRFPYFGSVDSTMLFVVVASKYFQRTHDEAFILEIWDNIVAAVNWMRVYGDVDHDHFFEYERKNPHGLFHQGWRDSFVDHLKIAPPVAIVEAQGYAYAAYHDACYLAEQLGKDMILLGEAKRLQEAFQKYFWWEEESYYYLALDCVNTPRKSVSSNPGHLLFTGIIPERLREKVVSRLFEPDIFTPYGIRTVSENDPDFDPLSYHLGSIWPHDNWIIYCGLMELGFTKEAQQIKTALLSAYNELGHMPELFGVKDGKVVSLSGGATQSGAEGHSIKANPLQAWATCALLNMIR